MWEKRGLDEELGGMKCGGRENVLWDREERERERERERKREYGRGRKR